MTNSKFEIIDKGLRDSPVEGYDERVSSFVKNKNRDIRIDKWNIMIK